MEVGLTSPSSISLSPTSGRVPQSSSAQKEPEEAGTPLRLADVQLECATQLGFKPDAALLIGVGAEPSTRDEVAVRPAEPEPEVGGGFMCCFRKRRQPTRQATLARPDPGGRHADAPPFQYRSRGPRDTPEEVDTRYLLRKEIGRGAYGKVYLATDTVAGMDVAIKVVDGVFNSSTDAKRTLREMTILRQCNHKNVAKCHTVLQPAKSARSNFTHLWLVLELAATDLGNLIKRPSLRTAWTQRHVQLIIYQALQGLQYMHRANIVHRDLKPSNILVTNEFTIKICDFGLSREIRSTTQPTPIKVGVHLTHPEGDDEEGEAPRQKLPLQSQLTKHVVTRWYRAPELILMATNYTAMIDVWSLGCIFAELLQTLETKATAVSHEDIDIEQFMHELEMETHQLNKIFDVIGTPSEAEIAAIENPKLRRCIAQLDSKPAQALNRRYPSMPDDAVALLARMLTFLPEDRASVDEALRSPYLEDLPAMPTVLSFDSFASPEDNYGAGHSVPADVQMDFAFEDTRQTRESLRVLLLAEVSKYEQRNAAAAVEEAMVGGRRRGAARAQTPGTPSAMPNSP